MGAAGRRRFLCFGVADAVADEAEEAAVKEISITTASGSEPELRRSRRRITQNFLRSLSTQSSSSRSLEQKPAELPPPPLYDDRKLETVLATSLSLSSNSSTASSSSTSDSSDSFREAAMVVRRKRSLKPAPATATDLESAAFGRKFDPARGLCLLLVCLAVMMFCGRLCAILWTSTWLCLVPIRNAVAAVPPETPSEDGEEAIAMAGIRTKGCDDSDKKRVVLDGLLERNRRI